jgi:hypothetical protein
MGGVNRQRQTPEQRLAAKRTVDARRARRAAAKDAKPPKPLRDPLAVRCGTCGGPTTRTAVGAGTFAAHKQPQGGRWCEAGATPSAEDRATGPKTKSTKVKRSVWATGGGLPTLGKNR